MLVELCWSRASHAPCWTGLGSGPAWRFLRFATDRADARLRDTTSTPSVTTRTLCPRLDQPGQLGRVHAPTAVVGLPYFTGSEAAALHHAASRSSTSIPGYLAKDLLELSGGVIILCSVFFYSAQMLRRNTPYSWSELEDALVSVIAAIPITKSSRLLLACRVAARWKWLHGCMAALQHAMRRPEKSLA